MSAAKKRTRAEEELAEQRRLAPVLQEAHARLRLWRTCDDKTCRRRGSCGGEVDSAAGLGMAARGHQGDAGREIADRGGRGRQFRRAGLWAASDSPMAELPVLGADRVGAAPRRQLGTRRYGARAAGYRLAIH